MPIEPIQLVGAVAAAVFEADKAKASPKPESAVQAAAPPSPVPHESTAPRPHTEEVQRVVDGQRVVYRFVDKETEDLILQIPSEQVLNVMKGIEEQMQRQATEKKLDESL